MSAVVRASATRAEMKSAPIPADWIRGGNPKARAAVLSRSLDGTTVTSVWDCTAGTFDWHFGIDETVYIVDGEVHVQDDTGACYILAVGDSALFRAGTSARWSVPRHVRKIAVCRSPVPRLLGQALRVASRIGALVMRRRSAAVVSHPVAHGQLAAE